MATEKSVGRPDPSLKKRYWLLVKGDSLLPRYKGGEYAMVDPSSAIKPGADVVVYQGGGANIRRFDHVVDGVAHFSAADGKDGPIAWSAEVAAIEEMHAVTGLFRDHPSPPDAVRAKQSPI